jgi:hypothetical protein
MSNPHFQVTLGTETFVDRKFESITVNRKENSFDTASLTCDNIPDLHATYPAGTSVSVEVKDASTSAWTKIFNGSVLYPAYSFAESAKIAFQCVGSGYPLSMMNCAEEYGSQSRNPTLDTITEILTDSSYGLIPKWVNKYLGGTKDTGYSIDTTKVETITGSIPYIVFNYKPVSKCLDDICDLVTAINNTGAHWIVDVDSKLRVKTIGSTQAGWTKYYGDSVANATLTQGIDFVDGNFECLGKEANVIVYYGTWRRPSNGDSWTNLNAAGWTNLSGGTTTVADYTRSSDLLAANANSGQPNVTVTNPGNFFVLEPVYISDSVNNGAERHYIANIVGAVVTLDSNLAVNYTVANGAVLTKDGVKVGTSSIKLGATPADVLIDARFNLSTICNFTSFTDFNKPDFNLSIYSVGSTSTIQVLLNAANGYFSYAVTPKNHDWVHLSLPTGPFKVKESDAWVLNGIPDWSSIASIEVSQVTPGATCYLFLDGMYFGDAAVCRVARQCFPTGDPDAGTLGQATNPVRMKILTDNTGKDDSLIASDDSGLLAKLAKSELQRANKSTVSENFTTPMIPDVLPGQYFYIGGDWRIKQATHGIGANGYRTSFEVTDDVTNSHTRMRYEDINKIYAAIRPEWQDRQASSIKAGDLDIRIARLEKAYNI